MNARRARGGFSGGVSTVSESLRMDAATPPLNDDDLLDADPEQMQNQVLAQGVIPERGEGVPNPRQRMNEVARAGDAAYSKEYRLLLLHRMLIRRIPLDKIAADLKVSISTIQKDRVELKKMLREQARQLNIDEMIGDQQEKYNEIAGMAMGIASATGNSAQGIAGTPTPMRLAALRTALAAEADRTRFLNTAGVFDVMRYRRPEDGGDISDVQRLMERTGEMMERMLMGADSEPVAPRRVKRTGGFKEFTMDDKDASSGDSEVQDL